MYGPDTHGSVLCPVAGSVYTLLNFCGVEQAGMVSLAKQLLPSQEGSFFEEWLTI
jgi:hypothetical protein